METIWTGGSHGVSHNKIRGYNVDEHYVELIKTIEGYKLDGISKGRFTCDCLDGIQVVASNDEEAIQFAEDYCADFESYEDELKHNCDFEKNCECLSDVKSECYINKGKHSIAYNEEQGKYCTSCSSLLE